MRSILSLSFAMSELDKIGQNGPFYKFDERHQGLAERSFSQHIGKNAA
jgi:hypothetical protein